MKAIIAAVIALNLTGCNIEKEKELNASAAVNMCTNMSFSLVMNEASEIDSAKADSIRDAVMYVVNENCAKKVMIYTRGVVVKNEIINKVKEVTESEASYVRSNIYTISEVTSTYAEKAAYFHTK